MASKPEYPDEDDKAQVKESSDEDTKESLKEFEPLQELLSKIPKKAQTKLLKTYNLLLTCIDADEEYIAIGTNVGLVFLYCRDDDSMQRLRANTTEHAITKVKLHRGMDLQVAFGTADGQVYIFWIPGKLSETRRNQMQKFDVIGEHKGYVSCLEWSTNGLKLFSADKAGQILTTEVDFYENVCKSVLLLVESGTEIVQLDYNHKVLLVSTKQKSYIVRLDLKCQVVTIGRQDHRMSGTFGACFIPGLCKTEDALLYTARAGCRLWFSDMKGIVRNTLIFPSPLSPAVPVIPLVQIGKLLLDTQEFQFGTLKSFRDGELVTWSNGAVVVLDPRRNKVIAQQSCLNGITDVAVVKTGEIFILRKHAEERVIRISDKPDSKCQKVEVPTTIVTRGRTGSVEKKEEKENAATSFFKKAFANPLKRLQDTKDQFESQPLKEIPKASFTDRKPFLDIHDDFPSPHPGHIQSFHMIKAAVDQFDNIDQSGSQESSAVTKELENDIVFSHKMKRKNKKAHRKEKSEQNLNAEKNADTISITSSTSNVSDELSQTSHRSSDITSTEDSTVSALQMADDMLRKFENVLKKDNKDSNYDPQSITKGEANLAYREHVPNPSIPISQASNITKEINITDVSPLSDKKSSDDRDGKAIPKETHESYFIQDDNVSDLDKERFVAGSGKEKTCVLKEKKLSECVNEGDKKGTSQETHCSDIIKGSNILDLKKTNFLAGSEKKTIGSIPVTKVVDDVDSAEIQFQSEIFNTKDPKRNVDDIIEQTLLKCTQHPKEPKPKGEDRRVSKDSGNLHSKPFQTLAIDSDVSRENLSPGTESQPDPYKSMDSICADIDNDFRTTELFRQHSGEDDFYSKYMDGFTGSLEESLKEPVKPIQSENTPMEKNISQGPATITQEVEPTTLANSWSEIITPANIYSLSMSNTHIWFTDKSENIYYTLLGGTSGIVWRKATGQASQISVSPSGHIVWRLHRNTVFAGTKISSRHPEGLKWVEAIREVDWIAVDDNCAWFIKCNGEVMVQRGLSRERPFFRSKKIDCCHQLKQIHCRGETIWAITVELKLLIRTGVSGDCPEGTDWELYFSEQPPYLFSNVAFDIVGQERIGWVIDALGQIWFCDKSAGGFSTGKALWWQVPLSEYVVEDESLMDSLKSSVKMFDPSKLAQILNANKGGFISRSSHGVCLALNSKNSLYLCRGNICGYRWLPAQPAQISSETTWKLVCANSSHLDGGGQVWIQHTNGDMYTFKEANSQAKLLDELIAFTCISAGPNTLWALRSDGDIKVRVGMTEFCPEGIKWVDLDLSQLGNVHMIHLSCNSSFVWAVETRGVIYQRIGVKPPSDNGLNPVWLPIDTFSDVVFTQAHCGPLDWMVWAIDNRRYIYVRAGITEFMPIGSEWKHVTGIRAVDLALTKSGVWALCSNGNIYFRHGITKKRICGNYWKKIPGIFTKISASANGDLWAITSKGHLMCCNSKYIFQEPETSDFSVSRLNSTSSTHSEDIDWEIV